MSAKILQFPPRPVDLARALRVVARRVPCPHCGAPAGRPCTAPGSPVVRIAGPHPDRIAAAEAAQEGTE